MLHTEMGLSCADCHGPQVPAKGEDSFEMSHDTCVTCHESEIGDSKQCMTCHKTVDVSGTAEIKMPHPVHMEMGLSCGECHLQVVRPEQYGRTLKALDLHLLPQGRDIDPKHA